jgi:hypothetical protein
LSSREADDGDESGRVGQVDEKSAPRAARAARGAATTAAAASVTITTTVTTTTTSAVPAATAATAATAAAAETEAEWGSDNVAPLGHAALADRVLVKVWAPAPFVKWRGAWRHPAVGSTREEVVEQLLKERLDESKTGVCPGGCGRKATGSGQFAMAPGDDVGHGDRGGSVVARIQTVRWSATGHRVWLASTCTACAIKAQLVLSQDSTVRGCCSDTVHE